MNYVAYYRVSADKQGVSGLGLEAQRQSVLDYLKGGTPILEFIEVDSGGKDSRVVLQQAIDYCKQYDATLVVARLDRLARSVFKISELVKLNFSFVACDMPEANKYMHYMMAILGEAYRDSVSVATKAACKSYKQRKQEAGEVCGWGRISKESMALRNKKKKDFLAFLKARMLELDISQAPLKKQVEMLNSQGLRTRQGKPFSISNLHKLKTQMVVV